MQLQIEKNEVRIELIQAVLKVGTAQRLRGGLLPCSNLQPARESTPRGVVSEESVEVIRPDRTILKSGRSDCGSSVFTAPNRDVVIGSLQSDTELDGRTPHAVQALCDKK